MSLSGHFQKPVSFIYQNIRQLLLQFLSYYHPITALFSDAPIYLDFEEIIGHFDL